MARPRLADGLDARRLRARRTVRLRGDRRERPRRVIRIVEGRARQVNATSDAAITLGSGLKITRVTEGQELNEGYTLELQDQLWMELKIDHGKLNGHAILAEAGLYAIDALEPDKPLSFRLRQGRKDRGL